MKMRKFKFLSLLIASTMLFACNSNTSSTAGGNSTPTPTAKPTTSAGDVSLPAGVSTIAQAQAQSASTVVTVWGVVINVTTQSVLISDGTGKIVIWLAATPSNTVGQYLQVRGALAERYGNMQFTSSATITVLTSSKPNITETAATWTSADVTTFTGKAAADRGLGVYAKFTGKLSISSGSTKYYNFAIEGVEKAFTASYIPTSLSAGLVSGNNYTVTGWVIDVSSSGYINFYAESLENVAIANVTGITIAGDAARTAAVGDILNLKATVSPFLANPAVTWSSSDATKAIVDANGGVEALAAGSVTITATTVGLDSANAAKTASVTFTISEAAVNPNINTLGFVSEDLGIANSQAFTGWSSTDDIIKLESTLISGNNAVKYYTTGAALRVYATNKLTFTVKAGYKVSKVRILTTDDEYQLRDVMVKDLENCVVTNCGVKAVITPTDGTANFALSSSAHFRIVNLYVDYEVVSE